MFCLNISHVRSCCCIYAIVIQWDQIAHNPNIKYQWLYLITTNWSVSSVSITETRTEITLDKDNK